VDSSVSWESPIAMRAEAMNRARGSRLVAGIDSSTPVQTPNLRLLHSPRDPDEGGGSPGDECGLNGGVHARELTYSRAPTLGLERPHKWLAATPMRPLSSGSKMQGPECCAPGKP
jgi:hypothetical protein